MPTVVSISRYNEAKYLLSTRPNYLQESSGLLARGHLWTAYLVVFVSSASTLVLELVAGRILAPYVGVSLYT